MRRCGTGVFTGLHVVADHCQVVQAFVLLGRRGLLLGADWLTSHGGVVGPSVLLSADWLLWMLGRLHGGLGGAGTGHQMVKASVEERLKAGGALKFDQLLSTKQQMVKIFNTILCSLMDFRTFRTTPSYLWTLNAGGPKRKHRMEKLLLHRAG